MTGKTSKPVQKPIINWENLKPEKKEKLREYRTLLSLDGGGLRGIITARVLVELEAAIKEVIVDHRKELLNPKTLIKDGLTLDKLTTDSFDVNLGDWFDQLAGTSTGGLLALYLAARGGERQMVFGNARAGSAQNACHLYVTRGRDIVKTTNMLGKFLTLELTGYTNCHNARGLEKVVKDVFGDATLMTLQTSTVVTAVDLDHARSGVFFYKQSPLDWEHKDTGKGAASTVAESAPDGVSTRAGDRAAAPPAARKSPLVKMAGFACPLRRAQHHPGGTKVLVHTAVPPDSKEACHGRTVSELRLETMKLMDPALAEKKREENQWITPMDIKPLDFKIWEVARATSAAPLFLPPITVSPTSKRAADKVGWPAKGIKFIDGGLANNDPTWMGLTMMLLSDNRKKAESSIANTAILSIGTGAIIKNVYEHSRWPFVRVLERLGGVIGLAMDTNGEDKENILNMIYYGLLRVPQGQYLRIQLKKEKNSLAHSTGSGSDGRDAQGSSQGSAPEPTAHDWNALNSMDDPNKKNLDAYIKIGNYLAHRRAKELKDFVQRYVFSLEDPYKKGKK